MALNVQYDDIRTEVIAKLGDQKEAMQSNLEKMDSSVDSLRSVMEGDALEAYIAEYQNIVQKIYIKLNNNLEEYKAQLESVCAEFEALDSDMQSQLQSNSEEG